MSPTPNARPKSVFVKGIVAAALIIGCVLAWLHWRTAVPTGDVTAYLDASVGAGRVEFSDVRVDTLRKDESRVLIAVAANATVLGPLY
jgi:hypothetical protein